MIYKRDFIDTLEARLSGGSITNDTRLKFGVQQLEAIVGMVFTSLLEKSPQAVKQMALPFELTPDLTDPKYKASVPVTPFSGNSGLAWVENEDGDWYVIRSSRIDSTVSSILKPNTARVACYYDNGYLYFTKKPSATVTAFILPNVHDMEDDQPLILEENEAPFLQMCFDLIANMSLRPMEVKNDGKVDSEQR